MQSLLQTTTSLASTLQSARAPGSNFEMLQTQVNFENTQELKAFATVDLAKINKDRQNQLKLALEDNMKEKDREMREVEASYLQHKEEYDRTSQKYSYKSLQLENQIKKQKEYLFDLKEELKNLDQELRIKEEEFNKYQNSCEAQLEEIQSNLEQDTKCLKNCEQELQVLQVQKKGLQMGIKMQKKVKLQELDMKIQPLKEEREKMLLNIEMLSQNLEMLQDMKSQNENEKMMIEEDLTVSEAIKLDLVLQREELEEFIENSKSQNYDLNFITSVMQCNSNCQWQDAIELLVYDKQKGLLLDLIRELQQYILGMSSGTTDSSTIQSDELEDIQMMIEQGQIQNAEAVDLIVEFAQRKIKLNISPETLKDKLDAVYDQIEVEQLQTALNEFSEVDRQMKSLDNRIKVVNNRCQNELKPRQKAVSIDNNNNMNLVGVK